MVSVEAARLRRSFLWKTGMSGAAAEGADLGPPAGRSDRLPPNNRIRLSTRQRLYKIAHPEENSMRVEEKTVRRLTGWCCRVGASTVNPSHNLLWGLLNANRLIGSREMNARVFVLSAAL